MFERRKSQMEACFLLCLRDQRIERARIARREQVRLAAVERHAARREALLLGDSKAATEPSGFRSARAA